MRVLKKAFVTISGVLLLIIGILFIILPGPAVLIIPLALAILATEYPIAKKWLRVFQQKLSKSARWMDSKLRKTSG